MSNFPKDNFTQASSLLDLVHSGVCVCIVHVVGIIILLLLLMIFFWFTKVYLMQGSQIFTFIKHLLIPKLEDFFLIIQILVVNTNI